MNSLEILLIGNAFDGGGSAELRKLYLHLPIEDNS